jgi:hypothetical protein
VSKGYASAQDFGLQVLGKLKIPGVAVGCCPPVELDGYRGSVAYNTTSRSPVRLNSQPSIGELNIPSNVNAVARDDVPT